MRRDGARKKKNLIKRNRKKLKKKTKKNTKNSGEKPRDISPPPTFEREDSSEKVHCIKDLKESLKNAIANIKNQNQNQGSKINVKATTELLKRMLSKN